MNEIEHKYYVCGEAYPISVTGVWTTFFPKFDSTRMSVACMRKAEKGPVPTGDSPGTLLRYLAFVEKLDIESDWKRR